MAYLIPNDYRLQIQDVNLNQIISNDLTVLALSQAAAEAEAKSYLRQKYDIDQEFKSLDVWDNSKTYQVNDRVYLDASAYVPANTYAAGALALYSGSVYKCKTNGTTGAWDGSKWDLIGKQYSIFSVPAPENPFEYSGTYNVGDKVYWKGYKYTCLVQTPLLSHDTGLQYRTYENLPLPNVAPDDPTEGVNYWGNKTAYTVPAGTLPTNTTYWNQSDNRDQQMLIYAVDLTLYHVHSRIAPRNIPELRVKRYDDAIAWLQMCAKGEVTPSLPVLQPKQGRRIRFGGQVRNINSY